MASYICYLPFRGEFGWYIMSFVKKIHGDSRSNKIVCIKAGHECLFPSATNFYYDWKDIPDNHKAGVIAMNDEETIKENIISRFPNNEIEFVSHTEIGWHNKHSFAQHTFIPQSKNKFGLNVDVVITPRNRDMDRGRNWGCQNWQIVVDKLVANGITVGVCGARETTCQLENVLHKSYDYIDVDSDVEMMNNAKLVITQESGMQYLSFLCQRPTWSIGHYHADLGADLHRNMDLPFRNPTDIIGNPERLATDVISFLKEKQ